MRYAMYLPGETVADKQLIMEQQAREPARRCPLGRARSVPFPKPIVWLTISVPSASKSYASTTRFRKAAIPFRPHSSSFSSTSPAFINWLYDSFFECGTNQAPKSMILAEFPSWYAPRFACLWRMKLRKHGCIWSMISWRRHMPPSGRGKWRYWRKRMEP
jgi:hypothetical protein